MTRSDPADRHTERAELVAQLRATAARCERLAAELEAEFSADERASVANRTHLRLIK